MDAKPPEPGLNLFLSWGIVEWALGVISLAGSAVAGWVWHLGNRVRELEDQNKKLGELVTENKGEIKQMQQLIRSFEDNMQRRIDGETQKLEQRMERLTEKLEQVREELPSRQFIEGQLNNLSQRLDRSIDLKMSGR